MYKAMLRGVLCANKCKIINFPWNENNVDQLFPIRPLCGRGRLLRQSQEALQASQSLQPSCRLTKRARRLMQARVQAESRDILTKSMELVVFY